MFSYLLKLLRKIKNELKEIFYRFRHACRVFKIRLPLLAIKSHINLPDKFLFEEKIAAPRGRKAPDGKYYSSSYEMGWEDIPPEIKNKIQEFDSVIRLYFGGDYLVFNATVWRNAGIPDNFRNLDIYSQVWHYDHVVDYKNLQLFVLMTDTTEKHGPLEYVENASETLVNETVEARSGAELPGAKVKKFTGSRGDALLFATGSTPHRAGIPAFGCQRDMFSIAFFPNYTGLGTSSKMLLNPDYIV